MQQPKQHHLSQGQINAMIQRGSERYVLKGAAARREIARIRAELKRLNLTNFPA